MPKIRYVRMNLKQPTLDLIAQANEIIAEYDAAGLKLTLRQLYYQFVSRDFIANTVQNYNKLGACISAARRAGLVDWSAIVDRTRNLDTLPHWSSPEDIVDAVARQFRVDMWENQPTIVEVWYEKDALSGIFQQAANALDVPSFSCRGYASDSEVWAAGQRIRQHIANDRDVVVLHFGDHDPSGIDMTRDIRERLILFASQGVDEHGHVDGDEVAERLTIDRVALNMDQVRAYKPPPNPAKATDARFASYAARFGRSSWELDALDPATLARLVETKVRANIADDIEWQAKRDEIDEGRALLRAAAGNWQAVAKMLRKKMDA
jgi:hypothetical protein